MLRCTWSNFRILLLNQMDLSLNIPKEFGYEFQFNFERSLVDFKKSLYDAKLSMQKKIQTDGIFVPREIEGNFYLTF